MYTASFIMEAGPNHAYFQSVIKDGNDAFSRFELGDTYYPTKGITVFTGNNMLYKGFSRKDYITNKDTIHPKYNNVLMEPRTYGSCDVHMPLSESCYETLSRIRDTIKEAFVNYLAALIKNGEAPASVKKYMQNVPGNDLDALIVYDDFKYDSNNKNRNYHSTAYDINKIKVIVNRDTVFVDENNNRIDVPKMFFKVFDAKMVMAAPKLSITFGVNYKPNKIHINFVASKVMCKFREEAESSMNDDLADTMKTLKIR